MRPTALVSQRLKRFLPFYLMMAPALLYFFVFRYIPMYGVTIGFKNYNVMKGILGSPWAKPLGKHFIMFFNSPYFVQLLRNTLLISFYKLAWGTIPPIILVSQRKNWQSSEKTERKR